MNINIYLTFFIYINLFNIIFLQNRLAQFLPGSLHFEKQCYVTDRISNFLKNL